MLVSGMMSARLRVLTSGLRTSYQPWIGIEPSQASTQLMVSMRGSKPMFWQTLKISRAASSASAAVSAVMTILGGGVAEADLAAFGLGDGVVGVGRHPERVLILERGAGARTDAFAEHRARALALLKPVAPVHADLTDRGPDRQRNRADRSSGRRSAVRSERSPARRARRAESRRAKPPGYAGRRCAA